MAIHFILCDFSAMDKKLILVTDTQIKTMRFY